jgi:PAS domain S-box-containing protein
MVAYIDVTNLLATEKALAAKSEEADMLALVARHTDSSVVFVDPDGAIRWTNDAFTLLNGYSNEEALGRSPLDLLHTPEERDRLRPQIFRNLHENRGFSAEVTCHAKDGRAYPSELEVRPVCDDDGTLRHIVAISKDITARREAEARLAQAERLESIGQLAAGVAHEINNPVGFVSSNLHSLRQYVDQLMTLVDAQSAVLKAPDDAQAQATLKRAAKAAEIEYLKEDLPELLDESADGLTRVKKIVQDLKDFSRVDQADWQQADLNAGLESTLNVVRNEVKYKCEVVKHLGVLPHVTCLAGQLNQVFMNLIVNASHAIADHGTITLRTGHDGDWVWIEVADTGCGMSEEVRRRIFEPFFTTKDVGKGTGLGLSLSFSIIKRHEGELRVTSTPGQGSTFRVWVPVAGPQAVSGQSPGPIPEAA